MILAEIYELQNNEKEAFRYYNYFLKRAETPGSLDDRFYEKLGDYYFKRGDYKNALEAYQAGLGQTVNELKIVRTHIALKNYKEALELYPPR